MRYLLIAALALLVAAPVSGEKLPNAPSWTSPGQELITYDFTSSVAAGIYTVGYATPMATLDFEFGSSFSAVLYECDEAGGAQGSGNGADSDGDGDLSDEAACASLVTLSASATKSSMQSKKVWWVLDLNTAEGASTTSRLTIKGTWSQVTQNSGGDWLVGGENGITDAANPNDSNGDGTYDDPIVCTLDPATCIFQSSAGTLWFATSSNQVNSTNWSIVNEVPLFGQPLTIDWGAAFGNVASYSGCMEHRDDLVYANANSPACSSDSAQFTVHRRFRMTRVTSSTFQGEGDISNTNGCDGRITEDDGATAVTGAEWQWPNEQSHAAIAEETIDVDTVTGVLNPGTGYQMQWKDGTNCENSGSCACGVGIGFGAMTIWGFYE